jgi:hypothetical protein
MLLFSLRALRTPKVEARVVIDITLTTRKMILHCAVTYDVNALPLNKKKSKARETAQVLSQFVSKRNNDILQ